MTLTKRQFGVLAWIAHRIEEDGYAPSFTEIAVGVGLNSVSTVHKHVTNLRRKGVLGHDYNCSRSIQITERGYKSLQRVKPHVLVQALALAKVISCR
jgi:SOS-response transcriptional repressor LexA